MAKIRQTFIESFLTNKLLESVKPLNEIKDALDPTEEALIKKIDGIIQDIIGTEI